MARGLYIYAEEHSVRGRHHDFYPLSLGTTEKVTYWSPIVVALEGRACVPFFDLRKSHKMTKLGKRFAFSAMHERIRASDPDFDEVAFAIVQFSSEKEVPRKPSFCFDEEFELFDFEELDAMTRETYEIWYEILDGRRYEARRSGGESGSII
ncbi:MAG: hypothetical protein AAGA09_03800 [Pseudomonadota bacterium]